MPNRSTDELFQLIKSLDKGEKRSFKLYMKRSSGGEDLKIIRLFDALDRMDEYDEKVLLSRNKSILKQQLSNMKASLYKQLLASLRQTKDDENIDIYLNEQMGYARILYNKGLYHQALKILDKIKQTAKANNQVTFQLQVLFFEKKIEALHITRSIENRAEQLSHEVDEVNTQLSLMSKLSSLSLQLYSWYIKMGHARDEKDVTAVKMFFEANLPPCSVSRMHFYEKMYLYQSHCWYGFILQDLLMYYRYAQKWVDIFEQEPYMKKVEAVQYIKAMHNLLSAHFDTNNYTKFNEALAQFEKFSHSENANMNTNVRIQTFVYLNIAKINKHFLEGTFTKGLELVPEIEEKLQEYHLQLDRHRILVFYYKIACLYFGSGDNEKAIDYLNRIINWKVDLRTDLQCYARLLHLIAHYELGNYQLLEYLIKSVYRFMAKMKNLSVVEEEIFRFLRKSFSLAPNKMIPAFKSLKEKLQRYEGNPLETRSFMYLDVIAWLESKIQNVPVEEVRRDKFKTGRKVKAVVE
ncbi:hypothetical protein FRZ67_07255 [Panacibacter ginsenosidivorans]|uniref:Tetratricopeptide repeat protein n=1 Tax=Panacibacter ginsenosidivorans TaxID=1813871 RepID=A0A5B8V7G9_9BACT|nr:hypothetical protein [Panacibacter ginsenosidivorans]QEC67095.1 hypothetical protein FRZ67_07255 [Panacibacter ginsenosidivorans]